jgi:hypothetical protein
MMEAGDTGIILPAEVAWLGRRGQHENRAGGILGDVFCSFGGYTGQDRGGVDHM